MDTFVEVRFSKLELSISQNVISKHRFFVEQFDWVMFFAPDKEEEVSEMRPDRRTPTSNLFSSS